MVEIILFEYFFFKVDQAAGNQANKNLCTSTNNEIAPSSAAIYQSPDYPSYPKASANCMQKITIAAGYSLKAYLNTAIFVGTNTKYKILLIPL